MSEKKNPEVTGKLKDKYDGVLRKYCRTRKIKPTELNYARAGVQRAVLGAAAPHERESVLRYLMVNCGVAANDLIPCVSRINRSLVTRLSVHRAIMRRTVTV